MMTDLPNLIELGLLLLAVGALAGLLAGLLGVGGGIVLVPALSFTFTALGYASSGLMQICIATSLASIVFTSMRSMAAHHKKGAVDWGILKSWAPGIVVGAIVGVLTAASLSSAVLQGIFGGLALIVGTYLLFGRIEWRLKDNMPVGPVRTVDSSLIGFLSVLMGIGGGSFGVPFMTLHGVAIHRAVATAAGFGLLIAFPSMIGFLFVPVEVHPPLHHRRGQPSGVADHHLDDASHRSARRAAGACDRCQAAQADIRCVSDPRRRQHDPEVDRVVIITAHSSIRRGQS
jgi:uncharacterized membrane protein YfcA